MCSIGLAWRVSKVKCDHLRNDLWQPALKVLHQCPTACIKQQSWSIDFRTTKHLGTAMSTSNTGGKILSVCRPHSSYGGMSGLQIVQVDRAHSSHFSLFTPTVRWLGLKSVAEMVVALMRLTEAVTTHGGCRLIIGAIRVENSFFGQSPFSKAYYPYTFRSFPTNTMSNPCRSLLSSTFLTQS